MTFYPSFGVPAPVAPLESLSRCLFHLSVPDLEWSATSGDVVAVSGHTAALARAATATCTDVRGSTYTAVNNQLPLESRDWFNVGSATGLGLRLGTSDRLPFTFNVAPMALAFYAEFIETAAAGFRFSLSNAGVTGARFFLDASANAYRLNHNNGTTGVLSLLGTTTAIADRVRLWGFLGSTGTVVLHMRKNEGAVVSASLSGAAALAGAWSAPTLYIGSLGTVTGGQAWLRRFKLVAAAPTESILSTLF